MFNESEFFNQPKKTSDCGIRCLYITIKPNMTYGNFLKKFEILNPVKNGFYFSAIQSVLDHYGIDYLFTTPKQKGTFIIWSTMWHKGGHYFVYRDGVIYDSLISSPYELPLSTLISKLEFKNIKKHSFYCLEIKGK